MVATDKDNGHIDPELRTFLSRSFQLKKIADYEGGEGVQITSAQAAGTVKEGKKFVKLITGLITTPPTPRRSPGATL